MAPSSACLSHYFLSVYFDVLRYRLSHVEYPVPFEYQSRMLLLAQHISEIRVLQNLQDIFADLEADAE